MQKNKGIDITKSKERERRKYKRKSATVDVQQVDEVFPPEEEGPNDDEEANEHNDTSHLYKQGFVLAPKVTAHYVVLDFDKREESRFPGIALHADKWSEMCQSRLFGVEPKVSIETMCKQGTETIGDVQVREIRIELPPLLHEVEFKERDASRKQLRLSSANIAVPGIGSCKVVVDFSTKMGRRPGRTRGTKFKRTEWQIIGAAIVSCIGQNGPAHEKQRQKKCSISCEECARLVAQCGEDPDLWRVALEDKKIPEFSEAELCDACFNVLPSGNAKKRAQALRKKIKRWNAAIARSVKHD